MTRKTWWQRFTGADAGAELERMGQRVKAMPAAEAVRQVEAALLQGDRFRVTANDAGSPPYVEHLPPLLARLLRQYCFINTIYGDVTISHELCGPSNLQPGGMRIGEDGGHWEIVIRPDEEAVYVLDGSEDDAFTDPYPSVYHYLLDIIALLHPDLVILPDP